MGRPSYEPKITLGTVIQLGAFLAVICVGWGVRGADVRALTDRQNGDAGRMDRMQSQVDEARVSLARAEQEAVEMRRWRERIEAKVDLLLERR